MINIYLIRGKSDQITKGLKWEIAEEMIIRILSQYQMIRRQGKSKI